MKIVFEIYHDILEDRIDTIHNKLGIDYYTKWESVKGKGHETDAHLGTRTFPGYNTVRMIAFEKEDRLEDLISGVEELNKTIQRSDDKIRLFQLPLDRIL